MFTKLKEKVKIDEYNTITKPISEHLNDSNIKSLDEDNIHRSKTIKHSDSQTTNNYNYNNEISPSSTPKPINDTSSFDESFYSNKIKQLEDTINQYEITTNSIKLDINRLNDDVDKKNEYNNKLKEINESLTNDYNNLQEQFNIISAENEINKQKLKQIEIENNHLKNDKDQLLIKNAELSQKFELLKLVNSKERIVNKNPYAKSSSTLNNEGESELIKNLTSEINEKNKVIKNLQQRLNDMKKTLQKELKYQILPNETLNPVNKANTSATSTTDNNNTNDGGDIDASSLNEIKCQTKTSNSDYDITKKTTIANIYNHHNINIINNNSNNEIKKITDNAAIDDINFKYLKHVVLKFFTSREYEAIHLIKALSVVLSLTNDEEKVLRDTLEWKMSWFGTKPKLTLTNNS